MSSVFVRFPGGLKKALTFSYDDGHPSDERLISIFDKYGLHGTFNLNYNSFVKRYGDDEEKLQKWVDLYKNHEVATHGLSHAHPDTLSTAAMTYELFKDREGLEKLFGRLVNGFAYAYGIIGGERTYDCMRSCGLNYGRVCGATHNFKFPTDWYTWHPTCHHKDPRLMELADEFLDSTVPNYSLLFYVWGHSFEFNNQDNWEIMENFASKMANRDDIWYATNGEIYDYMQAFGRLVWSLDGKMVHNPTAYKIWFTVCGNDYVVAPNETIAL